MYNTAQEHQSLDGNEWIREINGATAFAQPESSKICDLDGTREAIKMAYSSQSR